MSGKPDYTKELERLREHPEEAPRIMSEILARRAARGLPPLVGVKQEEE